MSTEPNKRPIAALALASAAICATANAEEARSAEHGAGYYVEARAGASFLEDAGNDPNGTPLFGRETEFDTGYSTGIAIGRNLTALGFLPVNLRSLRIEAEYAYAENDIEGGGPTNAELNASTFMANVYYDFPAMTNFSRVRPYVGAGVGAALISADGAALTDNDDTVFAYQIRAGLAYALKPDLELTLGYRFLDADDPEFGYAPGKFDSELRSHSAEAGLRYRF